MRLIALWLIPQRWAMSRVLQCVACEGVDSKVRAITRSTSASLIWRGAPGRGSSSSPSRRRAEKRRRHLHTEGIEVPTALQTAVFVWPSAQARMRRARRASA